LSSTGPHFFFLHFPGDPGFFEEYSCKGGLLSDSLSSSVWFPPVGLFSPFFFFRFFFFSFQKVLHYFYVLPLLTLLLLLSVSRRIFPLGIIPSFLPVRTCLPRHPKLLKTVTPLWWFIPYLVKFVFFPHCSFFRLPTFFILKPFVPPLFSFCSRPTCLVRFTGPLNISTFFSGLTSIFLSAHFPRPRFHKGHLFSCKTQPNKGASLPPFVPAFLPTTFAPPTCPQVCSGFQLSPSSSLFLFFFIPLLPPFFYAF